MPFPYELFEDLFGVHIDRSYPVKVIRDGEVRYEYENYRGGGAMLLPAKGQRWKHWKGPTYKVICIAKSAIDLVPVVVYGSSETGYWVRPVSEWLEHVDTGNGNLKPRFELVMTTPPRGALPPRGRGF